MITRILGRRLPAGLALCALVACVLMVAAAPSLRGQQAPAAASQGATAQPQQPPPKTTIKAVAEEVLLDVIVRDKRGRPVRDLKREEIEVREDDVRQQITAFRLIEGELVPLPEEPGAAPPDPLRQINLVTLVFERLSTEGRSLARQAAMDFLESNLPPRAQVAVFTIDQRLYVLQQFTNDRNLLKEAVDRATSGGYTQFISQSAAITQQLEVASAAQSAGDAAAASIGRGSGPPAGMGSSFAEGKLAQMTLNILRYSEAMQQEQQGRSSIFSLLSLVREQGMLAGRKTVIYFTEALVVPPPLVDIFRTTISAANRANVSVYGVDARGLLTSGVTDATRSTLLDAAASSRDQLLTGSGRAVTREDVMIGETAEASLRANVQGTLEDFSESTGGFLIANSNDFRPGMERVTEDIRSYYELAYRPPAGEYDGRFRRIAVKVLRPAVTVQTRSGYFALPSTPGSLVMPYEMPMLAALNTTPLPRQIDYHVRALHFAHQEKGLLHTLAMEIPFANFTFTPDRKNKLYRAKFALMALIKNAEGQVVQKFSRSYPVEGPLDRMDELKRRYLVFLSNFTLPAGRYTLETVAVDDLQKKVSARRTVLIVPPAREGVRMSSVAVVKRTDPIPPDDMDMENPLRFESKKIVPNLAEPIIKAPGNQLWLYMVVYPVSDALDKPRLAVQFLRDGQVVAQASPDLPAPDAKGRIGYVGTLPVESFEPGDYEVRAVVRQGGTGEEEHAFFTVSPEASLTNR